MHELLTPAQMAQADSLAGNGAALMQAAGRAVARAIIQHYQPCQVLALIGPGNNGGDGLVAADYLRAAGWPVRTKRHNEASAYEVARADLVIDAVFGAGLKRDLSPELADLLGAARRIVAVDVPSGVDGANGAVRGYAPQAELTVTFFRAKPGHYLFPGRGLCGRVLLRDIGLPETVLRTVKPQTWRNDSSLWRLPARNATGHKYTSGDVTVMCGEMPGAARLVCAAARRAGVGMVTLASEMPMTFPEAGLIVRHTALAQLLADTRRKVWVCGPGLGAKAGDHLATLISKRNLTIIADADALSACAATPDKLHGVTVITPHEAEFARVFGPIGNNRLDAAHRAAKRINAVTVLKGADTVIAAPDGRAIINANAPPSLATGGTGDVLCGIIAAMLAKGMPPFEACAASVWLHGAAASKIGQGLIAEDLPDMLPEIMR